MSRFSSWHDSRKFFNKDRRRQPRQASIYRWLTLGMAALVVATVLAGGLPAVGLIWMQMENQVQLRVSDAQAATQALYAAEQRNLLEFAQLVSEQPALCALLQHRDAANLTPYLETLRKNTVSNALIVVAADGQIFASGSMEQPLPEAFLEHRREPFADFIALETPSRLAIFATSAISSTDCEAGQAGQVTAVQILGNDFMRQLAENTGLEQSLILGGNRVATSLVNAPDWPLNPDAASLALRTREACCTMGKSEDETYYVGLAPLLDERGEAIALSEVALPADAIRRGVWNTIGLLFGIGILVMLGGAMLALAITRRITQPLRALSEAAERMGAGDLDTPVPLTSGWIAIDRLGSQLDHARRNLQQIHQITRRELKRVAHILGATREGVVILNEQGVVTWANSDACHLLGYGIDRLLRRHYSQIFRPAPGEVVTVNAVVSPPPDQPPPTLLTVLDAGDRPLALTVSAAWFETESREETPSRRECVLILRDVSEERAVNRLRSEFLANVAHEFRTPLSAISASTELLVEEGQDMRPDEVTQLAQSIRLSVVHLQALVNNLLENAIVEAGVFRLRIRPLQVGDILKNLEEMMLPLLQRREQRLVIEIADRPPSPMWGDADRLHQALVNLVENASKFSPSRTAIALTVRREADALTFSVADSGPGLPSERFEDLFSRFFTSGQPRGAQFGIGLGLPIVKAIAEAHGGRVGAENRPEGGARVWFTIPLRQGNEREGGQ